MNADDVIRIGLVEAHELGLSAQPSREAAYNPLGDFVTSGDLLISAFQARETLFLVHTDDKPKQLLVVPNRRATAERIHEGMRYIARDTTSPSLHGRVVYTHSPDWRSWQDYDLEIIDRA
jgi:hypothetical protein